MTNDEFTEHILDRGRALYRDMPWRQNTSFYYVLVSEIMLQQTQVDRVVPKFEKFINHFPSIEKLAVAPTGTVLRHWVGLGYNRRAKYLRDAAGMVNKHIPRTSEELLQLPGVGPQTAGAIMAYAYNQPVFFIETNIRTVYIHHFFSQKNHVTDQQIYRKLQHTIDHTQPRVFYWALMDYGAWLKKQGVRTHRKSKHYLKQSPLRGSVREVRGQIIAALQQKPALVTELRAISTADKRFEIALHALIKENLVHKKGNRYSI